MDRALTQVGLVLLLGLLLVGALTGYRQVVEAERLLSDPRVAAARWLHQQTRQPRGQILDRHGEPLVVSVRQPDGTYRRVYRDPALVHVTGYASPIHGTSNLEAAYDRVLRTAPATGLADLADLLLDRPRPGADVVTTIDGRLQRAAEEAMAGRTGAVVVLAPATGEILALVSNPFVDPNRLDDLWPQRQQDPAAPLLNRATAGLYPPGSVFKTVTLAAALETGRVAPTDRWEDPDGRLLVDGYLVRDDNHPGIASFDTLHAYAYSCNVTFARIGLQLGSQPLTEYAQRLGFGQTWDLPLPVAASRLAGSDRFLLTRVGLATTAFGQGEIVVTPLHMALLAATVANEGQLVPPRLVRAVRTPGGEQPAPASSPRRVLRPETARWLAQAMEISVQEAWGRPAQIPGVRVAGKTGTAEVGAGPPHAWFIAFAPVERPVVAVAVLVEHGGGGSAVAAPIARRILQVALAERP